MEVRQVVGWFGEFDPRRCICDGLLVVSLGVVDPIYFGRWFMALNISNIHLGDSDDDPLEAFMAGIEKELKTEGKKSDKQNQ